MPKRARPLHTCGSSVIAIGQNACMKLQTFDGPLGLVSKRAIAFFNSHFPFVYTVLYHWLAVLSFVDDHIVLAAEKKLEAAFPPSKRLFDEIDKLVCGMDALPEHIGDISIRFHDVVHHRLPALDEVLARLITRHDCCCMLAAASWEGKTAHHRVGSLPLVDCSMTSYENANATSTHVESSDLNHRHKNDEDAANNAEISQQLTEPPTKETLINETNSATNSRAMPANSPYGKGNCCSTYKGMVERGGTGNCSCTYKEVLEKGKKHEFV